MASTVYYSYKTVGTIPTSLLHSEITLLLVTYSLLGAKDNTGHIKNDGQGHFSNLTQLLLLVGHADRYGINQNQWIHAL